MKHSLLIVASFSMISAFADGFDVGLVTDRSYVFRVTHLADHPPVHFPKDTVADSSFQPVDSMISHTIRFSLQSDTIYIDTNSYGVTSSSEEDMIQYDLISSLGVCGRFVIWKNSLPLRAELTRFGFGVPIINSEKGILDHMSPGTKSLPAPLYENRIRPEYGFQHAFLINGQLVRNISNSTKIVMKNKRLQIRF